MTLRAPIPQTTPGLNIEGGVETLFALGEQFRQLALQGKARRKKRKPVDDSDDKSGAEGGSRRGVRDPSARTDQPRSGLVDLTTIIRGQQRDMARRIRERQTVGPRERKHLDEIEERRATAKRTQRQRVLKSNDRKGRTSRVGTSAPAESKAAPTLREQAAARVESQLQQDEKSRVAFFDESGKFRTGPLPSSLLGMGGAGADIKTFEDLRDRFVDTEQARNKGFRFIGKPPQPQVQATPAELDPLSPIGFAESTTGGSGGAIFDPLEAVGLGAKTFARRLQSLRR